MRWLTTSVNLLLIRKIFHRSQKLLARCGKIRPVAWGADEGGNSLIWLGAPPCFPPFLVAMGDTFLLLVQYQHGSSRFAFPLSRPISTSTSFVSLLLFSLSRPSIDWSTPPPFTLLFIQAQQSLQTLMCPSSVMPWFLPARSRPHLSAAWLTYIQWRQLHSCLQSAVSPLFLGQCDGLRETVSPFIYFSCAPKPRVSRGQSQIIQLRRGANQFILNEVFCKFKHKVLNEIYSRDLIFFQKIFSIFLDIYSQKWSSLWSRV